MGQDSKSSTCTCTCRKQEGTIIPKGLCPVIAQGPSEKGDVSQFLISVGLRDTWGVPHDLLKNIVHRKAARLQAGRMAAKMVVLPGGLLPLGLLVKALNHWQEGN